MNSEEYKNYWQLFEKNPEGDYSVAEIEAIITEQSKDTSDGLQRYLKFDLLLKLVISFGMSWVVYLCRDSTFLFILIISVLIGGVSAICQILLIRRLEFNIDFSGPVREVIIAVFKQVRRNLNIAGVLVGITNPLFIITGSFIYYFYKYGPGHTQDIEDTLVTIILMLIGFVLGYAAFSVQQNSLLNDLEISIDVLENDNDNSLDLVAKRRKRRMAITLALLVLGVSIFFILLASYLLQI